MTEADWLRCNDPQMMLNWLVANKTFSERKAKLFAAACCRRIWPLLSEKWEQQEVDLVEKTADIPTKHGLSSEIVELVSSDCAEPRSETPKGWAAIAASFLTHSGEVEIAGVWYQCPHEPVADFAANARAQAATGKTTGPEIWNAARAHECAAQADLLRCIFGPFPFRQVHLEPSWLASPVRELARRAYEERAIPSGLLCNDRLAVLADALEDAGCRDQDILGHLRQQGQVHVRGDWVIDLLLQRS